MAEAEREAQIGDVGALSRLAYDTSHRFGGESGAPPSRVVFAISHNAAAAPVRIQRLEVRLGGT